MADDVNSLLAKICSGDEEAFGVLTAEYKALTEGAVRRFAPSFGIDDDRHSELYSEDDLRQHASLALYKAALSYDPDDKGKNVSFGLYAKICVNNALVSQLRKYKADLRRREAARNSQRSVKRSADPLAEIISVRETDELMRNIAEVLSDYEKEIFDYYIDGKSVGEIAERLGKEEKSVSNALYRMKVKVKGLLKI